MAYQSKLSRFATLSFVPVLLVIVATGCSDLQKAKQDVKSTTKGTKDKLAAIQRRGKVDPLVLQKFDQIRAAYIAFYEKHQRGPASWAELRQGGSMSGIGNSWIREAQSEGYTVVWNLPIGKYLKLEDHGYLLAYDQHTVSRGGWVLLVNHEIERMSKSDFDYFYKLDPPKFDE